MRAGRLQGLLLLGAAGALIAPAAIARADAAADCGAVNGGALNVKLGSAARAEREVTLKAGDALSFVVHAGTGSSADLVLREGAGQWQPLLAGRGGTSASFVAAGDGAIGLRFAAKGGRTVAFTVTCVSAEFADGPDIPALGGVAAAVPPQNALQNALPGAAPATALSAPEALPPQAGGLALKLAKRDPDVSASGLDLGVNYKVLPSIVVGALAQYDQATAPLAGLPLSLSDQVWMAGPVTTVQVAPGLALDARAAWGFAEIGASDWDAKAGSAQRRLVSARLANTQSFGAWRFAPSINLSHLQEVHAAGVDLAAGHAVGGGRVDILPELAYRVDLAPAAFIEPKAAIGGFWGFDTLSTLAPGSAAHNDLRLKAEAGVTIGVTNGPKLQAAGGVEAGDGTVPDVWSGRLQLSIPMQ